jgi:hypothetical protein
MAMNLFRKQKLSLMSIVLLLSLQLFSVHVHAVDFDPVHEHCIQCSIDTVAILEQPSAGVFDYGAVASHRDVVVTADSSFILHSHARAPPV